MPFPSSSLNGLSPRIPAATHSRNLRQVGREPHDLVAAAEELLLLAKASKGRANKDLAGFASRIRELMRKNR